MQYFNQMKDRRRSQAVQAPKPVLSEDDEAFLRRVVSQEEQNAGIAENSNAKELESQQHTAPNDDTPSVPLPASPAEEFGKQLGEQGRRASQLEAPESVPEQTKSESSPAPEKKKKRWSAMLWGKNSDSKKDKEKSNDKTKGKEKGDSDNQTSSEAAPSEPQDQVPVTSETPSNTGEESQKDQEDMTEILEKLNLAADNNRVFSVSDETQELLRKFKLIFKDLVNGVPTAYHDLEMLLTNGNRQLQDTYTKLPGFMQKLIEKLPEKWTESLAPEMLAVASERASQSGLNMEHVGKAAAAAEKMGVNIPSLKELVSKPAALVGMLRSIMAFLRARFPAVLGMNVLWSLALFLLLFVLWYCHKRGREVRLENERLVTEEEIKKMNEDASEGQYRPTETLTTTAPQGASAEEVRAGVKNVERARASSALDAAATEEPGSSNTPADANNASTVEGTATGGPESPAAPEPQAGNNENTRPPAPPTRTKSRLSIWGRSKPDPQPTHNISPYPGT